MSDRVPIRMQLSVLIFVILAFSGLALGILVELSEFFNSWLLGAALTILLVVAFGWGLARLSRSIRKEDP